ncbi:MAG: peptidoglycan editing factor PgeF [Candidatus Omnitrophica bacterium]|nr:peptidoglycan editing factor PgeF [Candidatus Omnitrophota bacterium]
MSLAYGDTKHVLLNRRDFLGSLGVDPGLLVCAKQVHGAVVKYVTEADCGKGALSAESAIEGTDALITDKKNLPLGIFTADCLSIFLFDPSHLSIGVIHAGWRSTRENIAVKTINLMAEKFKTKAADLYVGFGPALRECCYEVGEEFKGYFSDCVKENNGKFFLDLVIVNLKQLLGLGVERARIQDTKICTCCRNKEYFSFRKEGNACGRIASVIMLK